MAEIVKILNKGSYISIELNDGEKFYISNDIAAQYSPVAGKIIGHLEYRQLKEESERFRCTQKALDYLSIRSRSSLELENYLKKKYFSIDIIQEIAGKLKTAGYINDMDYAVSYVKSKIKRKPVGQNLLRKELSSKGISRDIINRALKEGGGDEIDIERVYEIAKRKLISLQNKKKKMSKLAYFLNRRGFESEIINRIINRLNQEGYK